MMISMGAFVIVAALGLSAAGVALWQRRSHRRSMNRLMEMLDAAMDGSFTAASYDETLLSAVESRLDDYLSASAVSARNLEAEKEKIKELIADISHQTKTPLSNILLYAQLLGEQELPEGSRDCVRTLQAQAEKLDFLIAALVKLSRLEAGVFTLHPQKNPVQPLLDEIREQYALKAEGAGISLRFAPTDATAVFDPK